MELECIHFNEMVSDKLLDMVSLLALTVHRHGWMKLAAGSQAETNDQKSSSGHGDQHSEDDDYEEVAVCRYFTPLHLHNFLLLLFHSRYNIIVSAVAQWPR